MERLKGGRRKRKKGERERGEKKCERKGGRKRKKIE